MKAVCIYIYIQVLLAFVVTNFDHPGLGPPLVELLVLITIRRMNSGAISRYLKACDEHVWAEDGSLLRKGGKMLGTIQSS